MAKTFHKMHGLGNDFMLLDASDGWVVPNAIQVKAWADRHLGVGFDQLIFLELRGGHWHYQFFNADGSEAEQCGNGQRALAWYLHQNHQVTWPQTVHGLGGEVELFVHNQDCIEVTLSQQVRSEPRSSGTWVDVGNPHWVLAVDDVGVVDFGHWQKMADEQFPEGINIEFMQAEAIDEISIRISERGVGETQACGSGACAAAWVWSQQSGQERVKVKMPGGELVIDCDVKGGRIRMEGPARHIYKGVMTA